VTLQNHLNVGSSGHEVRHDYYQWVTLALIAQVAITYLPTFLWKAWEGGRIKSLVTGLQHPCLSDETRESSKRMIKRFLLRGAGHQRFYLCRFMICDLLNLAVVIGQLYFINFMVGDLFTAFNFDIIKVLRLWHS
jgi:innexin